MTVLRANATTLAKVATLAKIPVITSASVPQGPNGPLIPEIHRWNPATDAARFPAQLVMDLRVRRVPAASRMRRLRTLSRSTRDASL